MKLLGYVKSVLKLYEEEVWGSTPRQFLQI